MKQDDFESLMEHQYTARRNCKFKNSAISVDEIPSYNSMVKKTESDPVVQKDGQGYINSRSRTRKNNWLVSCWLVSATLESAKFKINVYIF